jgi:hypothetical protein
LDEGVVELQVATALDAAAASLGVAALQVAVALNEEVMAL